MALVVRKTVAAPLAGTAACGVAAAPFCGFAAGCTARWAVAAGVWASAEALNDTPAASNTRGANAVFT
jgi:hypothetical protein